MPRYTSGLCASGQKLLYTFLITHMHAVFPVHPILLDLITLIIYSYEYKL
jgi:hypothetical protein